MDGILMHFLSFFVGSFQYRHIEDLSLTVSYENTKIVRQNLKFDNPTAPDPSPPSNPRPNPPQTTHTKQKTPTHTQPPPPTMKMTIRITRSLITELAYFVNHDEWFRSL